MMRLSASSLELRDPSPFLKRINSSAKQRVGDAIASSRGMPWIGENLGRVKRYLMGIVAQIGMDSLGGFQGVSSVA